MINSIKTSYITRFFAIPLSLILGLVLVSVVFAQVGMGGTISGAVSVPNGYTLPAGTIVKLFEPGTEAILGQANVNQNDGTFSFGPVQNGIFILRAIPPSSSNLTQSVPVPVSVLGRAVNGVALRLTTSQITGVVFAPDGVTPITSTVKVLLGPRTVLQMVDAPGGNFIMGGLPPGDYQLQASPATDLPYWNTVIYPLRIINGITQSTVLTLTNAQLWGTTLDSQGKPVVNAVVHAVNTNRSRTRDFNRAKAHSSATGFWSIGGLQTGVYYLAAEPPFNQAELTPTPPFTVTVPNGITNPYTLTFRVVNKTVTGKVTSNTGVDISQAQVLAHRVDRRGRAESLTAADGTYQLNLSAGLWAMTVKPVTTTNPADWIYSQPPQMVYFERSNNTETKIENFKVISADSQVKGTVKMPGGSTPSFTVTVSIHNNEGLGRHTNLDSSGNFSLNIPSGGYKVVIHPRDPRYMGPITDTIRVEPNSTYNLGTLTLLAKDATITGTVRDGSGVGIEGIPVATWRVGFRDTLHTRTGPDGTYVLPVVAGQWNVRPVSGPLQTYLYNGQGTIVDLLTGQVKSNVDFSLTSADATINGQLVDKNGNTINDTDGWVSAVNVGDSTIHHGSPVKAGSFSIYVPSGEYNVAARLPAGSLYMSGLAKNITVGAGQAVTISIELLEKDATIAGSLWDSRKKEIVSGVKGLVGAWADGNWAGTDIKSNGTYSLKVAPGLWNLGYRIDPTSNYIKLLEKQNVPAESGKTAVAKLPVLFKDGAITGTVLASNDSPLAGVPVVAHSANSTTNIVLETLSRADGSFRLPVPYGEYRLGALKGLSDEMRPFDKNVVVEPGAVSGGHLLQFQKSDTTISGSLSISGTSGLDGNLFIWAWSDEGGFIKGQFPIANSTGTYNLNVISNTTWYVGAGFEAGINFWNVRETVVVSNSNLTQNLVLIGPNTKPAPVAVTFDAADPQQIELADGSSIFIPAGAMPVTGQVTLRIAPIATLPHQKHASTYNYGYAFLAVDDSTGLTIEDSFNQDVIIKFVYSEAELAKLGVSETDLKPAYFSTTTDSWSSPDSYVVDTTNNYVTMQIDHFTDFSLAADVGVGTTATSTVYLPIVVKK